jgi:amidase
VTDAALLATIDAVEQAELVRRGDVTPRELVEAAIERIESVNPTLNAVVSRLYERALDEVDAGLPQGPFRGVPMLLKDLGATLGGTIQTEGSRALSSKVSAADSELTRRYRAAGFVILGKTATPEFGNHSTAEAVLWGPTRNPWDVTRTTGGSSGGSGAAVASGMVPVAHGNDGAGSIRIPASCCGLVGLKPTRGRNSWAPLGDVMSGIAVEHVLTRTVRDSAAILDVTAGWVPGDPSIAPPPARPFQDEIGRPPGRLRIAWTAAPPFDGVAVDPACAAAARDTAQLLDSLGHDVDEAMPTFDGEAIIEPFARVWAFANAAALRGVAQHLGREPAVDELEETTWELVDYAKQFDGVDLLEALHDLAAAARAIAPFFERYDAWLTPTLARPPERLGVLNRSQGGALQWWRFDCSFNPWNPIANMTGQPAISLPLATTPPPAPLPIGVLLTGRFGDEATLFRIASQLEAARPWSDRRPSAPGASRAARSMTKP